jgi:ryanodine receptor 2
MKRIKSDFIKRLLTLTINFRILGITHAIVSLCMLIAYYNLKVPLALFKREKEVARRLEFDGLYLSEQPEDDDFNGHWDKLVISAK